jgi:hypothetical protein
LDVALSRKSHSSLYPRLFQRDVCPNPPRFDKIQSLLPSVDSRKQDPPEF